MFWLKKEREIRRVFRIWLVFKWISAGLQLIGGLLLLLISRNAVTRAIVLLTHGELIEHPKDYIAMQILDFGTHLSLSTKNVIAIYLLAHGIVNFYLLYGLWKEKINAFLLSAGFFSLFLVYQLYRYQFTHSVWLLVLSLLDVIYISLILHEYKVLKKRLENKVASR